MTHAGRVGGWGGRGGMPVCLNQPQGRGMVGGACALAFVQSSQESLMHSQGWKSLS